MIDPSMRELVRKSDKVGPVSEAVITELYSTFLSPNSVAVDGGANVGRHTFGMARVLTGSGVVHAFEPIPVLLEILRSRAKRFGNHVVVNEAALADHAGVTKFNYYDGIDPNHPDMPHWLAGSSTLRSTSNDDHLSRQLLEVLVTSLDTYFAAKPVPALDFIKLDIEGGEFHALLGARKTLAAFKPIVAFEDGGPGVGTVYGYAAEDFPRLLNDLGYSLFDILGDEYTAENWIRRTMWRPFYSVAIPSGFPPEKLNGPIERALSTVQIGT